MNRISLLFIKPNSSAGTDKIVGVGLGIRLETNQYLMFKTHPFQVVFIFTYLLNYSKLSNPLSPLPITSCLKIQVPTI